MGLSAVLVGCNAVPLTGVTQCMRADTLERQRGCACSGLELGKRGGHYSAKPTATQRKLLPASRQGRLLPLVRALDESAEGAATEPSSAARLVNQDTAAALPRQLEQSAVREESRPAGAGRGVQAKSTEESHSTEQAESSSESNEEELGGLKVALLSRLAGLDRGVAAGERDRQDVNAAASDLESAGSGLDLPSQLDKLHGKWRLVYTSSFSSGSFGGSRPGPPFAGSNLTLGQVFQRIDVARREVDNIVDLSIKAPVPLLPPAEVTATLAHSFEIAGPSDIRITFEDTRVQAKGLPLPEFTLPSLPEFLRSGTRDARSSTFATTFVDDQLRIIRGDREELRIFVKEAQFI